MPQGFGTLTKAGAPTSGVFQVETATVVGVVTETGNATVVVTAAGMTGSPITVPVPVDDGTLQVETATVVGTITSDGDVQVILTAEGMTGSPITTAVAVDNGTAQVETATVVGTIEAAGAGNATVIVTSAGMTGSPITVSVAVANDDTADAVAGKIRTALGLNAVIAARFTISGATDKVILTQKAPFLANDATLNIDINNGTCLGLTDAPSSEDTTAGVAPYTAEDVADAINTALGLNSDITDKFAIGGSGAVITLTRVVPALADDPTTNLSIDNGSADGLTPALESVSSIVGGAADGANAIAAKIRTALNANAVIAAFFTVSGATDKVVLTRMVSAANDTTMNIAIADDTSAGVATAATSDNTTAGVRGDYRGVAAGQALIDTTAYVIYENMGSTRRPAWTEVEPE